MSNLFAALGRTQLRRFRDDFAPKRVALATSYRENLKGLPGIRFLSTDLSAVVPHIQPIRVLSGRDQLREYLEREGIETGIHYKPNHLLEYYKADRLPLPVTERLYRELLTLPLHPDVSQEDVRKICDTIRTWSQTQSRS
jgi:dTDP-4-amino-4,6-dideoxygalactose transaminase